MWADLLANNFNELRTILLQSEVYGKFKKFGVDLLQQIAGKVGWDVVENEDHLASLLRSLVVPKLGILGDETNIKEALARFDAFVNSGFKEGISPDLRGGIFSIVFQICFCKEFERLNSRLCLS